MTNLDDPPDSCLDVKAQSGFVKSFTFEKNLEIPCASISGAGGRLAFFTCFSWELSNNPSCDRGDGNPIYVWPENSAKCDCVGIELPIEVSVSLFQKYLEGIGSIHLIMFIHAIFHFEINITFIVPHV